MAINEKDGSHQVRVSIFSPIINEIEEESHEEDEDADEHYSEGKNTDENNSKDNEEKYDQLIRMNNMKQHYTLMHPE